MVLLAVLALLLGTLCGLSGIDKDFLFIITSNTRYVLYLLMFLVGISVGLNRDIWEKLKEYHIKVFIIPFGVILGSVLGGMLCSPLLSMPIGISTAIASGMGWYSLTGVIVGELAGPELGGVAFLSNLMREIFSFFLIPWIALRLNYFTCIAPAGATSEDTTLPMLIRYTNEETVVLAVFNGVLCSAMVPVLIEFCGKVF